MPSLLFRNVPPGTEFVPLTSKVLYDQIAKFAKVDVDAVEVHISNEQYRLLKPDGTYAAQHEVHVYVDWFAGRGVDVKRAVIKAIQGFLDDNKLGAGADVTFNDYPMGSFGFRGNLIPSPF